MKCKYAVTFEFDLAQPETVRGEMEANASQTLVHRAVMKAKREKPNMNWSSMVVVLEKIRDDKE